MTSKATTSSPTITYGYNLANKLSSVTASGNTTSYLYNDQGIRVQSATTSGKQLYLVDANNHTGYAQVLEEFTDSGSGPGLTRSYVMGDDVLAQCYANPTDANDPVYLDPAYLLYDGHGSTRQLLHTAATDLSAQYNYDAYGVTLGTSTGTPETSLLYCGEQFDEDLKMYNLRARFYDPSNGRFNAMDTFRGNNGDPQSLHKYLYAHCDPVNGMDPSGTVTLLELALYTGIAGVGTFLFAAGLRYIGVPASITDRIEGLSRILNGIAIALTAWRFVNPAWIGAGFIAAMDEVVVGFNQLINGGRPPSPLEEFLRTIGLSNSAASLTVSIPKAILAIGPRTLTSLLQLVNWARNVKTFGAAMDDIVNFLKVDTAKISVADDAWGAVKDMDPLARFQWLAGKIRSGDWSWFSWKFFALGADNINSLPTQGAEVALDAIRAAENVAEGVKEKN